MHVSRAAWAPSALQALIVAAGLLPARARAAPAEPRTIDLRWEAPDGCPPADEVRSEIDRLLGTSAQRQPIAVEIAVARRGGARLRLDLRIRAPVPGERAIHGDDCPAMARAAALIVAMSIDPDAAARNAAAQPARPQASGGDGGRARRRPRGAARRGARRPPRARRRPPRARRLRRTSAASRGRSG
ncbi:hypothetical protein [Sorangium cellulosum]|uniref:Uncharacterized protein n=1 Tax=Sorangium cellulosum So0157-2 TaxID=1254432 RepID=S4XQ71_SORCE|nr:hypothetical protein [Sorangium cellulosum]AGP34659.1 hypothetical protein SCE1572_09135 [Sorangium cellulosum So0157-2]